jgi:NAD(P)-dependent dehydrogenase (short-subunit alcohol dehydrogenase family)
MIEQGDGGAIVLISSVAGLVGMNSSDPGGLGYTAAKHGMVGLMRQYANVLAKHSIRVNTVHPTGVNTPMIDNDYVRSWLQRMGTEAGGNALPVPAVEADDVANAVAWLVSDAARYVTGVTMPVDAGAVVKR